MDNSKWQEKGYADEPIPAGTDLKAEILSLIHISEPTRPY